MSSKSFSDESSDEEVNFVRKMKSGRAKYKGKFPFKSFECGRIGCFSSKCTFKESKDNGSDEELHY